MSKSENVKKGFNYKPDEYIEHIMEKQLKNLFFNKKTEKPENEDIPLFKDYNLIIKYNYNANQLKTFAKYYKLKITGNKNQLINVFILKKCWKN